MYCTRRIEKRNLSGRLPMPTDPLDVLAAGIAFGFFTILTIVALVATIVMYTNEYQVTFVSIAAVITLLLLVLSVLLCKKFVQVCDDCP